MDLARDNNQPVFPGRKWLLLFSLFAGIFFASAQSDNPTAFDTATFRKLEKDAIWMSRYIAASWLVNDTLEKSGEKPLARFGQSGCCIPSPDGSWQIISGTFLNEQFSMRFCLSFDSTGNLMAHQPAPDPAVYTPWMLALRQCSVSMEGTVDSIGIHMDQFIRRNADSTFQILVVPAFQPSGQGIYGAEWSFTCSPDGKTIISRNQMLSDIKGVWIGQPRELYLNYRHLDFPTTGAIYFAVYYIDFFTRIHIDTMRSRSTLINDKNGRSHWQHLLKN